MNNYAKIHPLSLGLTLGVIWSVSVLLMGLIVLLSGWGEAFVTLMGSFYVGYEPSILGAVIGMIWGFFDAFIGGYIIAWVYNLFAKKFAKS